MKTGPSLKPGSFHFRLLLYLLFAGSIPLLIAVYVFYQQSSAFAVKEQKNGVNSAHEQMLQRLREELQRMEQTAQNVAADYAVQAFIGARAQGGSAERSRLKAYIDDLLHREVRQDRYWAGLCLTLDDAALTLCSQPDGGGELSESFLGRQIQLYAPIDLGGQGNQNYGVRYTQPLTELQSGAVKGQVTVVLNLSGLLAHPPIRQPVQHFSIRDHQGRFVYAAGADAAGGSEAGRLVSDSKLSYANLEWSSHLEVRSDFASSSLHTLRTALVYIFAFLLAASLGSSLVFSRYVTKPLNHLRGLMKRAELGDLKAYWVLNSMEEMNDLGRSYNQMLNRVEELIKQVKQEEALKKEAEIEALQYQLNPHFLYNTLNTIKWVAKIHKTPQISEVVTALVRLLQASLGKKGDFLTLREETELIKDYMEIQSFRYGDKVKVVYELDELAARCLVPRMILQPLVENAILHGIEPAKREGVITIKAWIERDLLFCQVEDNGIGMSAEALDRVDGTTVAAGVSGPPNKPNVLRERMSGIGLRHIREKIKLYYGPDYKMHVMSKERQGTIVRLSLPIHRGEV
jgi:sensor histidine kinase YesM